MKRLLLISCIICLGHPAMAQQMTPMQTYVYGESGGYVPPAAQQPQPANPYNTATVAADGSYYYVQPQQQPEQRVQDVNQGVLGVNN